MQDQLNFLTKDAIRHVVKTWGTPVFVYSEKILKAQGEKALLFVAPYGLTVRYAMKANPNRAIIRVFNGMGIKIDASSGFEAERAIIAGVKPEDISITAQEIPKNIIELIQKGVWFNACSLHQLETFGALFPGSEVGVRINPGLGSGHSNRTNVGGPAASFGIWHEHVEEIKKIALKYNLKITRLHTHIGSGGDPEVWLRVAEMSIAQAKHFPDVHTVDVGGGFKVARMCDEKSTDLSVVSEAVSQKLIEFYTDTKRKIHLEIEPGTFLTANAGSLITTVIDVVNTGKAGYEFIKIDSGMTEIMRPGLYGAQHPLIVVNDNTETKQYVVVGHCCESGDLLTPYPDDPEAIATRLLNVPDINDSLVVEGVGAYCAYMSAQNYNSFPLRPEVMLNSDGTFTEIARRETVQEMLALEA